LWPSLNVGDPFLLLTRCGPKLSVIGTWISALTAAFRMLTVRSGILS
jgi:hypothetical protein